MDMYLTRSVATITYGVIDAENNRIYHEVQGIYSNPRDHFNHNWGNDLYPII